MKRPEVLTLKFFKNWWSRTIGHSVSVSGGSEEYTDLDEVMGTLFGWAEEKERLESVVEMQLERIAALEKAEEERKGRDQTL